MFEVLADLAIACVSKGSWPVGLAGCACHTEVIRRGAVNSPDAIIPLRGRNWVIGWARTEESGGERPTKGFEGQGRWLRLQPNMSQGQFHSLFKSIVLAEFSWQARTSYGNTCALRMIYALGLRRSPGVKWMMSVSQRSAILSWLCTGKVIRIMQNLFRLAVIGSVHRIPLNSKPLGRISLPEFDPYGLA